MAQEATEAGIDLLSIRRVPDLVPEQLTLITSDSLHSRAVGYFDAELALARLHDHEGESLMTVDLGGDKVLAVPHRANGGKLDPDVENARFVQSDNGTGYLQFLEHAAHTAVTEHMRVAVSFAGPMEGTRPTGGPNVPVFLEEFGARYGGDFANLFPTLLEVSNDAVAGLSTGAVEAQRWNLPGKNIIYIINGSGFGGAVLVNNEIYAAEPGHVPVVAELNQYDQSKPCGMFGATFTCVERVAAGKAGIEDIYREMTRKPFNGKTISGLYQLGDSFARDLYEDSATITAHVVAGMANSFHLWKNPGDTTVVFHGGVFHVPGYGNRVTQVLEKHLGFKPQVLFTKHISRFACAEGAAITALATA